jgi:hypothetical protein
MDEKGTSLFTKNDVYKCMCIQMEVGSYWFSLWWMVVLVNILAIDEQTLSTLDVATLIEKKNQ